jgi:hypothetical protein
MPEAFDFLAASLKSAGIVEGVEGEIRLNDTWRLFSAARPLPPPTPALGETRSHIAVVARWQVPDVFIASVPGRPVPITLPSYDCRCK